MSGSKRKACVLAVVSVMVLASAVVMFSADREDTSAAVGTVFTSNGIKYEVTTMPFDISPGEVTVVGYETAPTGVLLLPEVVFNLNDSPANAGYYIKKINASAFKGCTGITSIILPSEIINIGAQAFQGCTGVESIVDNHTYSWTLGANCFDLYVSFGICVVATKISGSPLEGYGGTYTEFDHSGKAVLGNAANQNYNRGHVQGQGAYKVGDTAILTAVPYSGYVFNRWENPGSSDPEMSVTITESSPHISNFYAHFSPGITYVLDGGAEVASNPAYYDEGSPIKLDPTSKTGHGFYGWFFDAAFTEPVTDDPIDGDAPITVYAKLVPVYYIITWKWTTDSGEKTIFQVVQGDSVPSRESPGGYVMDGKAYEFAGWSPALKAVSGDMTYVATYKGPDNTLSFVAIGIGVAAGIGAAAYFLFLRKP